MFYFNFKGPCCTNECSLKIGDLCRNDNGCRDASYCNGLTPTCPASINKPNKTVCNEEFVCYMGVSYFYYYDLYNFVLLNLIII